MTAAQTPNDAPRPSGCTFPTLGQPDHGPRAETRREDAPQPNNSPVPDLRHLANRGATMTRRLVSAPPPQDRLVGRDLVRVGRQLPLVEIRRERLGHGVTLRPAGCSAQGVNLLDQAAG